MDILVVKSNNELKRCFSFFKVMWKELFDIDFNKDIDKRKKEFDRSLVYYIGDNIKILAAIQFIKVKKWYVLSNWIEINKDAYILLRIWVLKEYRNKWLWSKLMKYWIQKIYDSWITIIYIPSEINNVNYYSKFWFEVFWKDWPIGNTRWIYMKKEL